MTWDITTPPDTESINQGASRIREFKSDMLAALTVEGNFPGGTPSAPVFRYTPPIGNTGGRPAAPVNGQLYINTDLQVIERFSTNANAWQAIATLIPPGTVSAFFQAVAPLGWTQVVTNTDAVLRVINDNSGGTAGGTDSISNPPPHSHSVSFGTTSCQVVGTTVVNSISGTSSVVAFRPKYINMIMCSKN